MLGFQQTKKSSQISNINVEEGANLYKSDRTKNYLQKPIHSSKHMTTSLECSFNGPGFPSSHQELRKTPQERERGRVTPADARSEG